MVNKCVVPGGPALTQKLLIVWGKDDEQSVSNNIWLLEIDEENNYGSLKWKKVYCNCVHRKMIIVLRLRVVIQGDYTSLFQLPPQANIQTTAWHIAQPYYVDGIQECSVIVFGGNAYLNKTLPGSPRIAVNNFKILEFGEFSCDCSIRVFNYLKS